MVETEEGRMLCRLLGGVETRSGLQGGQRKTAWYILWKEDKGIWRQNEEVQEIIQRNSLGKKKWDRLEDEQSRYTREQIEYIQYTIYTILVYTQYILDRNTGNGEND